jgi:hypothetical protein
MPMTAILIFVGFIVSGATGVRESSALAITSLLAIELGPSVAMLTE